MHGCVKNTCFRVTASYIWRIVFSPGGSHETEGRTLSKPMSALGQKQTVWKSPLLAKSGPYECILII